jgi:hypothetical protein
MKRRTFLQSTALMEFWDARIVRAQAPQPVFEPWKPGMLDIHHLAYGRGNSTFVLCPDATTILIDAGTTEDSLEVSSPQRPNANMRPGEWIATYLLRQMQAEGRTELDYFLLTHIHPDHIGDLGPENPRSPRGDYRLTGLMDIDARIRIAELIDRGFPEYGYPAPRQAPFALNYLAYVKIPSTDGGSLRALATGPGKSDQASPRAGPISRVQGAGFGRERRGLDGKRRGNPPSFSRSEQFAQRQPSQRKHVLDSDPHQLWGIRLLYWRRFDMRHGGNRRIVERH